MSVITVQNISIENFHITDISPEFSLPAFTTRDTAPATNENVSVSQQLKDQFDAGNLLIFIDGVALIGYPMLGPQPPIAFLEQQTPTEIQFFQLSSPGASAPAQPPIPILSGDVVGEIDNNQLTRTGVVPGIYTSSNIAVDEKGRITAASNGVSGSGSNTTIIWNEIPAGVVDGVNDTFVLAFPPDVPDDLILTKNGIVQKPIAGNDYALSGAVIVFEPGNIPLFGDILLATYQSVGATLTPASHESLRQLIHFIDSGPAKGFLSGAFKEILPAAAVFPTTVTWWESPAKIKKIVEKTIAYTGILPTTIQWIMYLSDGVTPAETAVDTIAYSGVFETTRNRAIS